MEMSTFLVFENHSSLLWILSQISVMFQSLSNVFQYHIITDHKYNLPMSINIFRKLQNRSDFNFWSYSMFWYCSYIIQRKDNSSALSFNPKVAEKGFSKYSVKLNLVRNSLFKWGESEKESLGMSLVSRVVFSIGLLGSGSGSSFWGLDGQSS